MTKFQRLSKYVALAMLAGILLIAGLFLKGTIAPAPMKTWMLILTAVWFTAAAIWMNEKK
jgi:glucose dehydrogenase